MNGKIRIFLWITLLLFILCLRGVLLEESQSRTEAGVVFVMEVKHEQSTV